MSNALARINIKDVAREALRALVVRKLDPSPDNHRPRSNEIAGADEGVQDPAAESALERMGYEFPRSSPELLRIAKPMEPAGSRRDGPRLAGVLHEGAGALERYYASAESWRALLADL